MPVATPHQALHTRFAPSPTGRLHAGNIFACLVAWILARRSGGRVVLRIEDLDRQRSRDEYARLVLSDLENLGLLWDEGPYYQSRREDLYCKHFELLQDRAFVYPCFCTRADLHAAAAPHPGETTVYPGTCRMLDQAARKLKEEKAAWEKRAPAWRIAVEEACMVFRDHFQGEHSYHLQRDCGDFVLKRSDGGFAYQLAVVCDDADMGINCVVRGADLLNSTAQQLFLQQCLGFPEPCYYHVPLLVNAQGRRIAKRDADASLDELLQKYRSYEGILGHIAYSCGMIGADEATSAAELCANADLTAISGVEEVLWSA